MYLFRSIEEGNLKNLQDLRLKVIRHFKDPMPRTNELVGELIDLCQSGFERDVFSRLAGLGYCLTPQVSVGSWSIDLVVEGENDRRLAIELDGDKWHPPEKWLDDILRQRAMERMGWRFWRCWASSFFRDPGGCMADLVSTLTACVSSRWHERIGKTSTPNIARSRPANPERRRVSPPQRRPNLLSK
jgi:very-short-patch-repair endonuclease